MSKPKRVYYGYWYEEGKEWKWTEKLLKITSIKNGLLHIPAEHMKSVIDHGVVYLRKK